MEGVVNLGGQGREAGIVQAGIVLAEGRQRLGHKLSKGIEELTTLAPFIFLHDEENRVILAAI